MTFLPLALVLLSLGPEPNADVSLQDVLEMLRSQSKWVEAEHAQVTVATTELIGASVLPNPSIGYGGLFLTSGANTGAARTHEVRAEQPLLLFGQLGVRREMAERGIASAQADFGADYAARNAEVREAFAHLQARQGCMQTIARTREDMQRAVTIVRGRAAAGDRSPYDVLRIEVEARTVGIEFTNAVAEVNNASGKLAALLSQPNWHPHAIGELQPAPMVLNPEILWQTALTHKPVLMAAQRHQEAANVALTLARRERLPVPELATGVTMTQDAQSLSTFVGLSLPIPMFNWGQGPIAQADAEAKRAALTVQAARAEAEADLRRAVGVLEQRRMALEALEVQTKEHLPAMRAMAEASYQEGRGGILELLDAFRTFKELNLKRYEQLEAVKDAEVELLAAAGLLDTP